MMYQMVGFLGGASQSCSTAPSSFAAMAAPLPRNRRGKPIRTAALGEHVLVVHGTTCMYVEAHMGEERRGCGSEGEERKGLVLLDSSDWGFERDVDGTPSKVQAT